MADASLKANNTSRITRYGWQILSALASLSVAIGLVIWSLKGIDTHTIWTHIKRLNPQWLYLAIMCSLLAFYLRSLRWNLLLRAKHEPVASALLFWTLMASYLVNYALPRIGEAYRCGALKRKANRAATHVLGTVLLERIVDLLCMGIAFGIALALAPKAMQSLWNKIETPTPQQIPLLALSLVLILGATMVFLWWLAKKNPKKSAPIKLKLRKWVAHTKEGLISLGHTPYPLRFLFYTIAMWMLYFLNTYCIFQCLPESEALSVSAAWVVMVAGGIGMTAPVQGGIGTFHILVGATLLWFGIPKAVAAALTSVIYGSYAFLTIGLGAIGLCYVALYAKKPKRA